MKVGDTVMLQNQSGNHPLCWDKRGTVMKCKGFDFHFIYIKFTIETPNKWAFQK